MQSYFVNMRLSSFAQHHISQGNGHYFPLKNQTSESHNPLLANEDMWEESGEGSDEESLGESPKSVSFQLSRFSFCISGVALCMMFLLEMDFYIKLENN